MAIRLMVMTRMLAFLAFVGHELASSLRDILGAMGIADIVAIGPPVAHFALAFGVALRRLYRLHYRY